MRIPFAAADFRAPHPTTGTTGAALPSPTGRGTPRPRGLPALSRSVRARSSSRSRAWVGSTSSEAGSSGTAVVVAAPRSSSGEAVAVGSSTVDEAARPERAPELGRAPERTQVPERVPGRVPEPALVLGRAPAAVVPVRPRRERGPVRERGHLVPQRSRAVRPLP